jgi:hypothetical protein
MAEKVISIFISYSHLDNRWFKSDKPLFELVPFLERSLRNVRFWYDRHVEQGIEAGDDFQKTIEEEIDKADIAILLISQEFINSRFIFEKELPRIQKRYDEKTLQIFPVLIEPCLWEEIEFISKLQMVPGKPTPLINFTRDESEWTNAKMEILRSLKSKIDKLSGNTPLVVAKPIPEIPKPEPEPSQPTGDDGRDTSVPELTALLRDIPDLARNTLPGSPYTCTLKPEPDKDGIQVTLDLFFQDNLAPNGHQVFHMPDKHTFTVHDNRIVSLNIVSKGSFNLSAYDPDVAKTLAKALTRLNSILPEKSVEAQGQKTEQEKPVVTVKPEEIKDKPGAGSNSTGTIPSQASDSFPVFEKEGWCKGTGLDLKFIGSTAKDNRITIKNQHDAPLNMQVHGLLAFVPVEEGLRVFDTSDIKSPKMLSLFPAPYLSKRWFELLGDIGIMRSGDGAARVIDLKDPSDPKEIFFENHHRNVFNNCGNGLRVYKKDIVIDLCHDEGCGVKVLDFSDHKEVSKNVRKIGVINFSAGSGTIVDDYLLLGSYKNPQLRVVQLNEEAVKEIRTFTLETDDGAMIPTGMVAGKGRLYIVGKDMSSYHLRLAMYSLNNFPQDFEFESCIERPKEHSCRTLFGLAIHISDNWLYYSDKRRLIIYDITNPVLPVLAFEKDGPFNVAHIADNLLYCADDRNLWIFKISGH